MGFKMKGMNKIMSNTKGTKAFKHAMKARSAGFRNVDPPLTEQEMYEQSLKLTTDNFSKADISQISPEQKAELNLIASDAWVKENTTYSSYDDMVENEPQRDVELLNKRYSNNQFYKSAQKIELDDLSAEQKKALVSQLGENRTEEDLNQLYTKDGEFYFDQGWSVTNEKQVNTPLVITDIIKVEPANVVSTARNQGTGENINVTEDSIRYYTHEGARNAHVFSKDNPHLPETGNIIGGAITAARRWERLNGTDKSRVVKTINNQINRYGDTPSIAEDTEREVGEE
jgi:hypothetical protein